MPWYNENFDFDLEKELDERKIVNNNDVKKFLDLGYWSSNTSYMDC